MDGADGEARGVPSPTRGPSMHPVKHVAPLLLASSLLLVACGSSGTESVGSSPSTAPTTSGTAAPIATVAPGTKVSANDASTEEITAALAAAGVENADAWADEVVEHRPYAADDPSMQDVRDALAEYDPPAEVLDAIVSALTP